MRGEHCVAGASVLSFIAVILLVFVNIGQVGSGAVVKSLYFTEVNVAAYGAAYASSQKTTPGGLYDTSTTDKMGTGKGLRQYYRYGIYNACGYQTSGAGTCNSTIFGYPYEPLSQFLADVPSKFKPSAGDIIPPSTFKDNGYNHGLSRAAGLMIFVGSCLVLIAFVIGFLKSRITFLVAAASSGLAAVLLMVGSAMWTAIIAKNAWVQTVKVSGGVSLGINVSAGPSLYLTWVSFALVTLSVLPYVVACCTFRRN